MHAVPCTLQSCTDAIANCSFRTKRIRFRGTQWQPMHSNSFVTSRYSFVGIPGGPSHGYGAAEQGGRFIGVGSIALIRPATTLSYTASIFGTGLPYAGV